MPHDAGEPQVPGQARVDVRPSRFDLVQRDLEALPSEKTGPEPGKTYLSYGALNTGPCPLPGVRSSPYA
jgi:hypothetical protein